MKEIKNIFGVLTAISFLVSPVCVFASTNEPRILGVEISGNFYEQLPSRPILTASAGVLPDSNLYFLDKFDEWAQENIFSFGVSTLKVRSLLQSASERAAEVRRLEVNGQLTDKLSRELSEKMLDDLETAATLVGKQYQAGSNPVGLTKEVIRTTLASINSLENSFREAGNFFLSDNENSNIETQLGSIQFLGVIEDRVWSELFPEDVSISPDVLKMAVQEKIAVVRSGLDQAESSLNSETGYVVAGKQLIQNAEEFFAQALLLYRNENYLLVADTLKQARDNYLLLDSPSLQITPLVLTDPEPESRIKEMLYIVQKSGFVDVEQSRAALSEALNNLKKLKQK